VSDILICVATAVEGEGIPANIAGRSIVVVETGVGPVNAAFALTRALAAARPRLVVSCGIGGAYPGSGLEPGDVACAESDTYGDLGSESPDGFLDMQALGFPVVAGTPPLFNRLPLDVFPLGRPVGFVTCATCTGTDETAARIVGRTGGAVESMEGAAIVHVARLSGVPVAEIRGISNPVGRRDRARWKVREAVAAARAAVIAAIEDGRC
jgi:futalosine hydrolase